MPRAVEAWTLVVVSLPIWRVAIVADSWDAVTQRVAGVLGGDIRAVITLPLRRLPESGSRMRWLAGGHYVDRMLRIAPATQVGSRERLPGQVLDEESAALVPDAPPTRGVYRKTLP